MSTIVFTYIASSLQIRTISLQDACSFDYRVIRISDHDMYERVGKEHITNRRHLIILTERHEGQGLGLWRWNYFSNQTVHNIMVFFFVKILRKKCLN